MTIRQIIKRGLLKLKVKYPHEEEDNFFFNLQNFKDYFEKKNDQSKNFENFLLYISKNGSLSKAQLFQDLLVDFFLNKEKGYFCEVGACDGLVHSNTYFLEKNKKWSGILCEPASFWIEKLKTNRPGSIIETSPVFSISGININFKEQKGGRSFIDTSNKNRNEDTKKLNTISLNDLFTKNNVKEIDYLSIDTEGTEFEILKSLNFEIYRPKLITIEHNYKDYRKKIFNFLQKKKYKRIFKSVSRFDDWYLDNLFFD
tara:strand:- start:533 stop:1303 length:771 start_codon:yes stop_codon:yes gene_type:complete